MSDPTDIFTGLNVLLVSEDEVRTHALSRVLRERRANVGDLKISARDPVALRGADLLIIDTRSAVATAAHVAAMRSDVRARWASVASLDFANLVRDDGSVTLESLESAVRPLCAADRNLTERAKREQEFSTVLAPLGPTRTLRALGLAGPTVLVEISSGAAKGSLTLSNELLVCAFMERAGERWEAWDALARILGLTEGRVRVARLLHPSAMNIMEPLDQALQAAAQARAQNAAGLAREEQPKPPPVPPPRAPAPRAPASPVDLRVSHGRTLLGVAAPALTPEPAKPAPSRYVVHGDGAERIKPGRTMIGLAPGVLPSVGGGALPKPSTSLPAPPQPIDKLAAPEPANTQGERLTLPVPRPSAEATEAPTMAPPGSRTPPEPAEASGDEASDDEASDVAVTVPPAAALGRAATVRLAPMSPAEPAAESQLFPDVPTARADVRTARALLERSSWGDMPTDPAPRPTEDTGELENAGVDEEEATSVTNSDELERAVRAADQAIAAGLSDSADSILGSDFAGFGPQQRENASTRPFDATTLMDAIREEVPSSSEGKAKATAADESTVTSVSLTPLGLGPKARRSSALRLLGVFVIAAGLGGGALWWLRRAPSRTDLQSEQRAPLAAQAPAEEREAEAAAQAAEERSKPASPAAEDEQAAAPQPESEAVAPIAAAQEPEEPRAEAEPVSVNPKLSVDALIKEGGKLLRSGDAAGAEAHFEAAVGRAATNPHAQSGLAEARLELGDAEGAQAAAEIAVRLRGKRARYRVLLGDALKAQGKLDEARTAWQKALEIDPRDRDAKKRLGS